MHAQAPPPTVATSVSSLKPGEGSYKDIQAAQSAERAVQKQQAVAAKRAERIARKPDPLDPLAKVRQ